MILQILLTALACVVFFILGLWLGLTISGTDAPVRHWKEPFDTPSYED